MDFPELGREFVLFGFDTDCLGFSERFARCRLFFESFEFLREFDFFLDEFVTPYVGLEYRVEREGVITDDLTEKGSTRSSGGNQAMTYLLFDVEHRDMGRNRNLSERQVSQQRRFTDTVSTDDTVDLD